MNIKLNFDTKADLNTFINLLDRFHEQLTELESTYCCDDSLYNDMAVLDSVVHQIRGSK